MDDSEKSYGYSEDLYHGRRAEKSYEYGAEGETGDAESSELAPEEEAVHIVGPRAEEPEPVPDTPEYDYGREGTYAAVESFTWESPEGEREGESEDRSERTDVPEAVSVGGNGPGSKEK